MMQIHVALHCRAKSGLPGGPTAEPVRETQQMLLQPSCKVLSTSWKMQDSPFGRPLNPMTHASQVVQYHSHLFAARYTINHLFTWPLQPPSPPFYLLPHSPISHVLSWTTVVSDTVACPSIIRSHAGHKRSTSDAQPLAHKAGSGLEHRGLTSWLTK